MNEESEVENQNPPKKPDIVLDSYRWVIVIIFAAYSGTNFFMFMQFSIIANITERYYHVDSFMTDTTVLVFMGAYIIFFIPVGHFTRKKSLKQTVVISSGLTALGNSLKLFAVSQDRFYLVIISQAICGLAQVFIISLPPQVANTWFGAKEVSIACAIGVMGSQIGIALGVVASPFLVPDSYNMQEIADGFSTIFTIDNVLSITMLVFIILFFRSKPDSPPSQSQIDRMDSFDDGFGYLETFEALVKIEDYKMVLLTFGLSFGIGNGIGIVMNEMFLHFFPGDGKNLGILLLCGIIAGGVFGTMLFGCILDKTHEFKKVTTFVLVLNAISWTGLIMAYQAKSLVWASLFIPIMGFFNGSLVVIGFEYATETTYPIPERYSASLLNASIYMVAILAVLVIECVIRWIGFFTGQIIFAVLLFIAAFCSFFISSDYRRRDANLLSKSNTNYGSFIYEKLP